MHGNVSDIRQDVRTIVYEIRRDVRTIVSEINHNATSTMVSEIHRTEVANDSRNMLASDARTLAATEYPLTDSQTQTRSAI